MRGLVSLAPLGILVVTLLVGCAAPPPAPIGVTEISRRPAEGALLNALRAYDEADYGTTERQADEALRLGLQSPRDTAMAHKLRAFVYCTSNRIPACEAEFRAARTADPDFALTRAEAGHPLWGPAYLRSKK